MTAAATMTAVVEKPLPTTEENPLPATEEKAEALHVRSYN